MEFEFRYQNSCMRRYIRVKTLENRKEIIFNLGSNCYHVIKCGWLNILEFGEKNSISTVFWWTCHNRVWMLVWCFLITTVMKRLSCKRGHVLTKQFQDKFSGNFMDLQLNYSHTSTVNFNLAINDLSVLGIHRE
jgi:hypothetical protein